MKFQILEFLKKKKKKKSRKKEEIETRTTRRIKNFQIQKKEDINKK